MNFRELILEQLRICHAQEEMLTDMLKKYDNIMADRNLKEELNDAK